MYNKRSVYALNKEDQSAIVYPDVTGSPIRLTIDDFMSEEEFLHWKQWSDQNYHIEDNGDVREAKHTIPLGAINSHSAAYPGPEAEMLLLLERRERGRIAAEAVEQIQRIVTQRQYRRMWLYYVEGLTQQEIAAHESVGQQRISVSLTAAKKRIKKNFSLPKK